VEINTASGDITYQSKIVVAAGDGVRENAPRRASSC